MPDAVAAREPVDSPVDERRQSSETAPPSCMLWVGTCGYSYTEWVEAGIYPRGARPTQMLGLYAQLFSATEINNTWYQMPKPEAMLRTQRRVPRSFLFAIKLTRTLTHEIDPLAWKGQALLFREGVAPLLQAGQLAAVLVQFPSSFQRTPLCRQHLSALLDALDGLPLAVEFRHRSWAQDRVMKELQKRQVTLVTVDVPPLKELFPTIDAVTRPELVYMRLHGRNGSGWKTGSMEHQFNYDYSLEELSQLVDGPLSTLLKKARRALIFFNNHVAGQAPRNAQLLTHLLRQQGYQVLGPAGQMNQAGP